MQGLGVLLLSIGAWLIYCATTGVPPLKTAAEILGNPGSAEDIIAKARQDAASASAATKITNSAAVSSGDGGAVVAFARKELGKPYVLGGHGPDVWDCSGLTMEAYKTVGVSLPHSALAQSRMGVPVTKRSDLQQGDLLFPTGVGTALGDHVQIYSGNGNVIEAPDVGKPVRERTMWGFSGDKVTARRMVKGVARASGDGMNNGGGGSGV